MGPIAARRAPCRFALALALSCLAALCLTGCEPADDANARVVLVVDAEDGLKASVDRLLLKTPADERTYAFNPGSKDKSGWPKPITLKGRAGSTGTLFLTALKGEKVVLTRAHALTFVKGRRVLYVRLNDACRADINSCDGPSETCGDCGTCVERTIDPADLPKVASEDEAERGLPAHKWCPAPMGDGGEPEMDAGDASIDGALDGGPEAGQGEAGSSTTGGDAGPDAGDGSILEQCGSVCTTEFPCVAYESRYVCRGLFPEWSLADPADRFQPDEGEILDTKTGLHWQQVVDALTYSWAEAKEFCATRAASDSKPWRLPTKMELESIVDFDTADTPTIDLTVFPTTLTHRYWTSVPHTGEDSVWQISFVDGSATAHDKSSTAGVRCVY